MRVFKPEVGDLPGHLRDIMSASLFKMKKEGGRGGKEEEGRKKERE